MAAKSQAALSRLNRQSGYALTSVEDGVGLVLAAASPLDVDVVDIAAEPGTALGRVLAQDVRSVVRRACVGAARG
jgi:molybdopterin biosynthesis enzyme